MTRLLLATTNPGKVEELRPQLGALGLQLVGLEQYPGLDEPVEDQDSFEANARLKALHYAALAGIAVLADDSGLEVDALDGAPGVRSARWAGEPSDAQRNLDKLLRDLQGETDRSARFRCALCLVRDGQVNVEVSGACEGVLLSKPRGQGGFGYDPIFVPAGHDRTFAEMSRAEKQALSHRGRAVAALVRELAAHAPGRSAR